MLGKRAIADPMNRAMEKDNTGAGEFYKRRGLKNVGIIFEMDI